MDAKLVVVGGEARVTEVNLDLPVTVGRGRSSDLALPHPLVSRKHCEIYEEEGKLVVNDLGSLNGTFVGDQRIAEPTFLMPGELLTVGTVTFRAVYNVDEESTGTEFAVAGDERPPNDRTMPTSDQTVSSLSSTDAPAKEAAATEAQPEQAGGDDDVEMAEVEVVDFDDGDFDDDEEPLEVAEVEEVAEIVEESDSAEDAQSDDDDAEDVEEIIEIEELDEDAEQPQTPGAETARGQTTRDDTTVPVPQAPPSSKPSPSKPSPSSPADVEVAEADAEVEQAEVADVAEVPDVEASVGSDTEDAQQDAPDHETKEVARHNDAPPAEGDDDDLQAFLKGLG